MKPQIPLCNSTMCQRICMGTFVMCLVANWLFNTAIPMNWVALVTLIVLGVGMAGTSTHLGKPGRILGAMRNPTSHLSLEMITCIPVGLTYLIIGLNGLLYTLPTAALVLVEVLGFAASVLFIWVTARAYRLVARPAWNTPFTPLNFMLAFLSAGSLGACFAITLTRSAVPLSFLALAAVLVTGAIAGQLFFTYYVGRVGYHVDVKALGEESRGIYTTWLVLGVVVPVVGLTALFVLPASVIVAGVVVACYSLSLAFWQAFFFISGKEVWYFPQYDMDLNPNYY